MKAALTSGAGASRPKNVGASAAEKGALEEQAGADSHAAANSASIGAPKHAQVAELRHEPEPAAADEYSSLQQLPAAQRTLKK